MIDGLQYFKTDEFYTMAEVFEDDEIYGYRSKNLLDISDEKNIYDHVIFDSIIEKQFAEDAENDENVLVYAKLPMKFKIDTPYGNYSPDWVVVMRSEGEHKLYFVAETKGSRDKSQLRGTESAKILSGRKHFEVVDKDIIYDTYTQLRDLLE
jgi:type III restriction enzyme